MARGGYKLLERDCVTFTDEIAKSLGLDRPNRDEAKFPQTYIRKLVEMNK